MLMTIQAVEMPFERIHVRRPEAAELGQPGIDFLQWPGLQSIHAALRVHRGLHKTRFTQHSQMFRHGWLRHSKLTLDLAHRLLRRDQQTQYRAAVGLGNDLECSFHITYILYTAYTCQGILCI